MLHCSLFLHTNKPEYIFEQFLGGTKFENGFEKFSLFYKPFPNIYLHVYSIIVKHTGTAN